MTEEQLYKANKINQEIKRINDFLFYAERTWTGKVVSNAYGMFESKSYEMDTETKNQVLDVLRNKLNKLTQEMSEI